MWDQSLSSKQIILFILHKATILYEHTVTLCGALVRLEFLIAFLATIQEETLRLRKVMTYDHKNSVLKQANLQLFFWSIYHMCELERAAASYVYLLDNIEANRYIIRPKIHGSQGFSHNNFHIMSYFCMRKMDASMPAVNMHLQPKISLCQERANSNCRKENLS